MALLLSSVTAADALRYRLLLMGIDARVVHQDARAAKELARLQPDGVVVDVDAYQGPRADLFFRLKTALRRSPGIFVLSASGDMLDRIVSLECGAEDHIDRATSVEELALRLLRFSQWRAGSWKEPPWYPARRGTFTLGPILVDPERRGAFVNRKRTQLTAAEMRLLCYLAERAPAFTSRQQLLADLWDEDTASRTVRITTRMKSLRNKLEGASRLIESVAEVGVRLADGFQPVFSASGGGAGLLTPAVLRRSPAGKGVGGVPRQAGRHSVATSAPDLAAVLERELPGVEIMHLPQGSAGDAAPPVARPRGRCQVVVIRASEEAAGWSCRKVRQAREEGPQPAILALAEEATPPGALALLESGADDAQPWPMTPRELGLRVRVLLRRHDRAE